MFKIDPIFFLKIYLFLAVPYLHCCTQAFSGFSEGATLPCSAWLSHRRGFSCGHGLWTHRLQWSQARWLRLEGSGAQAWWLWCAGSRPCCVWGLPRVGAEPLSPALAGGFPPAAPPAGQDLPCFLKACVQNKPGEGCCWSVPKSCPTLCDIMDCSTPGFPVFPGAYSDSCPLSW